MTQESPIRPPVRSAIRRTLAEHTEGVADDLLIAMVHDELNAQPKMIRATLTTMERNGLIYNASGDAEPTWKLTNL